MEKVKTVEWRPLHSLPQKEFECPACKAGIPRRQARYYEA